MMKKMTAVTALALTFTSPVMADTIFGIYAGGGSIDYDLSGDFTDLADNGDKIDLERDLGISGDTGTYFYIAIEHPIPLLPNFKLAHSDMESSARATLDHSITFDGETFPAGSNVSTTLDASHTDFTFYYEILDNWVNLDLGVTARQFDGGIEVVGRYSGFTYTASQDLDSIVPLLYAKARFDLPLTGLYVGADINWLSFGGSQLYDVWANVGYTFAFGLGVEAGYRKMQLTLDDIEDLDTDITMDGNYLAATFHF